MPRYGLGSIRSTHKRNRVMAGIRPQLPVFKLWNTALFQADRPVELLQLGCSSWRDLQQRLFECLGYYHSFHGVQQPRLDHYLEGDRFVAFIAFLQGRGVDKAAFTKHTHAAIRVVSWLATRASSSEQGAKCQEVLQWLHSLSAQLKGNMVKKPRQREPHHLKQQGRWLDAPTLMARVEAVRQAALAAVAALQSGGGELTKLQVAGLVNDSLLSCMCFGYMPPLRATTLLSITLPSRAVQPCQHADCQAHMRASGCQGNRVYKDPSTALWHMDLPHHKNSRRWSGAGINVPVPLDLVGLLEFHVKVGHGALSMIEADDGRAVRALFLNVRKCDQALGESDMAKVFTRTVLQGTGVRFGPQMCRSIFVVGTRDMQHQQGVGEGALGDGAAMVMGNSQQVWDSVYDRHFNTRQAREAMDAMPMWRQQMLAAASHQQQQQQPGSASHQQQQQSGSASHQQQQQQLHQLPPQLPLPSIPAAPQEQDAPRVVSTMQQLQHLALTVVTPPPTQEAASLEAGMQVLSSLGERLAVVMAHRQVHHTCFCNPGCGINSCFYHYG